jgi:magnesium transporter
MSAKSLFEPSPLPDSAPQGAADPSVPAAGAPDFSHPADRAERLEQLSPEERVHVLRHLPVEEAADALAELDSPVAGDMLESMDAHDAARILSEMWIDDAVDILDEVTETHRDALLSRMAPEEAHELRTLLAFDPDTAAGVMNTEIITIRADLSVDDAIRQIRAGMDSREMPYYVYAVDEKGVLAGVLSLRDLMLSRPGTKIREALGKREVISVGFDADKEEVARLLGHYNFLSLPVVDRENHLMGVVTYDDVIDILQDEATADMLGMVGAGQDESVDTPWLQSVKLRLPWLAINMLNSSLSAFIVYMFEGSIAQMAFLAVLMPMVANQAGNTGQQALAVMIRQLATERFDSRKAWIAVLREGKIGLLTGAIMAACAFTAVWLLSGRPQLAGVMSGALLLDMTLGAVAGGSIPLILRALRRDPAQASSIFLTTLTDGAGFFIFLSMATLFLL